MIIPSIRPAQTCDLSELSRLYVEFHQFHVRGIPGRLVSLDEMEPMELIALADNLRRILENPMVGVFVAELDGRIEGFIEVYDQKTEPHPLRVPHRFLYIQSIYVRRPQRRLRIGKALLQAASEWGCKRGLDEIQLDAWEFPGGPQVFYENMGFRTLRRTLVSKIDLAGNQNGQ